jgi:hypothetical protein
MDPSEETTAHAGADGAAGGAVGGGAGAADGGAGGDAGDGGPDHRDGTTALSLPSRIVITVATAAVALGVAFHLLMVFLHVAPQNTLSTQRSELVNAYIYPEFEQNWKLFAPNPLQANIHVWARAQIRKDDGDTETLGWVDLTAMDIARIQDNPAPSHTQQNELRRAWSFYSSTHGDDGKPIGERGILSQQYVQRIVETRFGPRLNGGDVIRVQVRTGTTMVAAPPWSPEKTDTTTRFQVLTWWTVPQDRQAKQGENAA